MSNTYAPAAMDDHQDKVFQEPLDKASKVQIQKMVKSLMEKAR